MANGSWNSRGWWRSKAKKDKKEEASCWHFRIPGMRLYSCFTSDCFLVTLIVFNTLIYIYICFDISAHEVFSMEIIGIWYLFSGCLDCWWLWWRGVGLWQWRCWWYGVGWSRWVSRSRGKWVFRSRWRWSFTKTWRFWRWNWQWFSDDGELVNTFATIKYLSFRPLASLDSLLSFILFLAFEHCKHW